MWTAEVIVIVCATFLFAGWVKGVVGLGLPTIALALLAATVGLREAIALMLVPALVTNVWQALTGGAFAPLFRRLWPLLLAACLGTWFGVGVLAQADTVLLTGVLGVMICAYAGISLAPPRIPPPGRWEGVLSPTVGAIGGIVTGLTGSFIRNPVPSGARPVARPPGAGHGDRLYGPDRCARRRTDAAGDDDGGSLADVDGGGGAGGARHGAGSGRATTAFGSRLPARLLQRAAAAWRLSRKPRYSVIGAKARRAFFLAGSVFFSVFLAMAAENTFRGGAVVHQELSH